MSFTNYLTNLFTNGTRPFTSEWILHRMMTIPILSHDVVREVVSYLENDRYALHSCILVDRLWCQIGIEMFWRDLWKFRLIVGVTEDEFRFWGAILRTLTSCLPNSSKELLMSNGVNISSYNPGVQLFDYPAYSKSLDCVAVSAMIEMITYIEHQHERPRRLLYIQHLLEQEICKMFINKCDTISVLTLEHIPLAYFPRAQECFSSLTDLRCHTAINETLFFAMAQFCRNIERITIEFFDDDNLGLASLIEMQQDNLKYVKCLGDILGDNKFGAIVDVFKKNARFYTHLDLIKFPCIQPMTIATMMNLHSLKINLIGSTQDIWTELSNAYLPKLEILHLHFDLFSLDVTRRIIANNDGNLYNIVVDYEPEDDQSDALNDTIAQYCPNLKFLVTWFMNDEWQVLENMMIRCRDLKCLILRSMECRINGDILFKLLCSANMPKSLRTLGLSGNWDFSTQMLKSFLKDCKQKKKRIAFYFSDNEIDISKEHREILKNYHKKGIIRWYKIETSFKLDLFL